MRFISLKAATLAGSLIFASTTVTACGADASTQPPRLGTRIVDAGGNGQMAYADTILPKAFVVQVKGPDNKGVAGVPVEWRITSGAGELLPAHDSVLIAATDASGLSSVTVRPSTLGLFTVNASTPASPGVGITFSASIRQRPDVVIRIQPGFDCGDPSTFVGPDSTSDVNVAVGALIEWTYPVSGFGGYTCTARLRTLTTPVGGTTFDQLLPINEVFQFRVDAVGVWTYSDALNGGTGSLTVRAR
jgi:hypothetical protein